MVDELTKQGNIPFQLLPRPEVKLRQPEQLRPKDITPKRHAVQMPPEIEFSSSLFDYLPQKYLPVKIDESNVDIFKLRFMQGVTPLNQQQHKMKMSLPSSFSNESFPSLVDDPQHSIYAEPQGRFDESPLYSSTMFCQDHDIMKLQK